MTRKWVIGCCVAAFLGTGFIVAAVVFVVVGVFVLTRPLVDTSEQFLVLLGQGKSAEAYALTASSFRAVRDESSFTRAAQELGLTECSSVSWHNRQIRNQDGLAEGTVRTSNGSSMPVFVQLTRENGKWVIVGLSYGGRELTSAGRPPVPGGEELQGMVAEALLEFNRAVQSKDFTAFYDRLSLVWKKQTSPERLAQDFKVFIDKQIDIGPIKNFKPQMAPATIKDDDGMLVVTGHYATEPEQVRFELEYSHEGSNWRLSGISVRFGKASATE
jgi:hypothetical protein